MKVFIDGKTGTTGLNIYSRLSQRDDVELITLSEELRHDASARSEALNSADYVFLCLPDDAAREAVSMIHNPDTVVIDASTAHRTNADWAYGLPELDGTFMEKLRTSKRIAVPGCHASGFITLVYPLVKNGIISADENLHCFSLTGYSGGGKKMIAEYESEDRSPLLSAPRHYALAQQHKHLKEMKAIAGIEKEPAFCPVVADFYSGMLVTITLFKSQLGSKTVDDVIDGYKSLYTTDIVKYIDGVDEAGFLSAAALSGKDSMQISVFGNEERVLLAARYDNLGKGACGAALECLNISSGADEKLGLVL